MSKLVLTDARLIDGTGAQPRDKATVVIDDGRISEVHDSPQGLGRQSAVMMDLEGRTVMPGLINAHMHIMFDAGPDPITAVMREGLAVALLKAVKCGEQMIGAGITAARDLGGFEYGEITLSRTFSSGSLPGPRLLCAGRLITMTGGHGWQIGHETDGPHEVRKAARKNLKQGADCIKMMATGGVMTPGVEPGSSQLSEEELRAGVEEAHHVGKKAASHAQGTEGVKNALRAGIDTIEHGIFLDEEAIEMIVKRGVVYVPTLAAPYQIVQAGEEKGVPAFAVEKSRRIVDAHRKSFEWAVSAGVTIAAGNDGGTPFNPSHDLVTELRLMVEYGLNPLAAIRSATFGSARALGISEETGTIQPGKQADILILESNADPLTDMTALSKVWMVIKEGKIVVQQ
jgi:imidazolonepropionase-like amidohydrolase